jgi:DNA polymerase-3 subunit delta
MPRASAKPQQDPLDALRSGQAPRPIYAIDGEERVLVDEAVRLIKEKTLEKQSKDFNLDRFTGKDAPLAKIVDAAMTLPAFAKRRMVLVEQADKLDLDGADALIRYIEDPSPSTVLVLVAEKLDARTKVYKALQKGATLIRYTRPRPREMPDFIRARARLMGVNIEEPAIRALVDTIGTDAGAAIQALDLLALYVGDPKKAVKSADVEALISDAKEESVFQLVDAIGKQDRPSAISGIHSMLTISREPALVVLAMIARHFRNLLRARSLIDAGASRADIESAVGIPPYFLDNLLSQARRQSVPMLAGRLRTIADFDQMLKGGPLHHTRAMERLVLELMRGVEGTRPG